MPSNTFVEVVSPNEGALLLSEVNMPGPLYNGVHRYQFIRVVRGDEVVTYKKDLGIASLFKGTQIHIPGGEQNYKTGKIRVWETVANLQGLADELRNRTEKERKELLWSNGDEYTEKTPAQWQDGYLEEVDRQNMAASKKSVSGTHFSTTR